MIKEYENKIPVYILIRTSNRPLFFKNMMESIKNQTYENIITVVHTDSDYDLETYVTGDVIIKGKPRPEKGRGFYNLYNNTLLENIPVDKYGSGYYHFIDDDDKYSAPDVIEKLVKESQPDKINVGRVRRWEGSIWPKDWKAQLSFQTECFFLHTDHRFLAKWPARTGGDHAYSRQITKILNINWIGPDKKDDPEFWTICSAQEGKGRGERRDLGDPAPSPSADTRIKIAKVGARLQRHEPVEVIYKQTVKGHMSKKGKEGQVKFIPKKYAEELIKEKKVEIVSNPFGVKLKGCENPE